MVKEAPSFGRILAMVAFAASCFGLLLFLWTSFGGVTPLAPEGYRFKARFDESTLLVQEAEVRISGIAVGRVKTRELGPGTTTEVEIELEDEYRAYRFRPDDAPVRLAFAALAACGFEPRAIEAGGAADANVFNERGLQCLNLANGMAEIHTPDEHIAVADLEAMVEVTLALIDAARDAA